VLKGEKTRIFWWGLIILGISVVELFTVFWYSLVIYSSYSYYYFDWRYLGPPIFGGIVFLFIGLYMMKSGVRKEEMEK
jgi:putative Mn2+ efflux pump MntP